MCHSEMLVLASTRHVLFSVCKIRILIYKLFLDHVCLVSVRNKGSEAWGKKRENRIIVVPSRVLCNTCY